MGETRQKFQVRAKIFSPRAYHAKGKPKGEPVVLHLMAVDREDARWQCNHGVLHASVSRAHPGATLKVDLRRLRRVK